MDFQFSEKSLKLQKELSDFMLEYINDQEQSILNFQKNNIWINDPKIEDLKIKAKQKGLWNLFLPKNYNKLNKATTINKNLKDYKEFTNKFDFNEPNEAQLISSSLGTNNEILLRYLYKGKNILVVLDVKTKKIKSIITIKKGQNSFKINK